MFNDLRPEMMRNFTCSFIITVFWALYHRKYHHAVSILMHIQKVTSLQHKEVNTHESQLRIQIRDVENMMQ